MKKIFLLVLMFATSAGLMAQSPAKSDPWAGLRFLLGTWEAKTTGGNSGAQGTGAYSFRLELKDHVLARHSSYASCKGPEDFNCEHGDLMYIYADRPGQEPRAIYFDNEGHVIHYAVSVPRPGTVVLLSDPGPWPQFRLTYELQGGVMAGKFQVKMPGQDEFSSYLEWSGPRKNEVNP